MSKIKNGGLDQYGAELFEQQQFEISGVEEVNVSCPRAFVCALGRTWWRICYFSRRHASGTGGLGGRSGRGPWPRNVLHFLSFCKESILYFRTNWPTPQAMQTHKRIPLQGCRFLTPDQGRRAPGGCRWGLCHLRPLS